MLKTNKQTWLSGLVAATLFFTGYAGAADQVEVAPEEKRVSITNQLKRADRDLGSSGILTNDEFPALTTQGSRKAAKSSPAQGKASSNGVLAYGAPNTNFWFYTADVILFNDNDGDGFFHGIDLLFDADTYYSSAEVYAVVYLSLEGGPWNEYAATENFILNGASADDEYVIVTELVNGYPAGSYDLLIELFDTYDDSFVASFGPEDTSELAFLQLEDAARDAPQQVQTVIVKERGGGSFGWLSLLLLGATTLVVRRR